MGGEHYGLGRARGLMEPSDPGCRVNRRREKSSLKARPGGLPLPGFPAPCSRAGNTPPTLARESKRK
jgi:hypothetical protein